jgi:hypothetical protein
MQALLLAAAVLAASPRADAALRERFAKQIGPAIAGAPDCYGVDDRYAACLTTGAGGELRSISVRPRAWLLEGEEFDRDRSLTNPEFLEIVSRLNGIAFIGGYRPGSAPAVVAVTNLSYTSWESWTGAAIEKGLNVWDASVLDFTVIFYQPVRGRVVHRDQRCNRTPTTAEKERAFMLDCDDRVSVGPRYLSIDNGSFLLAPEEWRDYCEGEEVAVMAVDLDPPLEER